MDFLKPAKYFFVLSTVLTIASIAIFIYPGPRYSIEFTGGTRMNITIEKPETTVDQVKQALTEFGEAAAGSAVNKTEEGHFILRFKPMDDATNKALVAHLNQKLGNVTVNQYTTIGPTVGETLKKRSIVALLVASLGIILYLAWAFRSVPRKYSPWKFGITAVATLLHDIMVTVGIFVILSYYTDFEVDTLFVTALLTILGYAVADTIVVFDRIRDNLAFQERKESFEEICNRSLAQTIKRSLYTSTGALIMLFSLFFFGSHSIQWFMFAMIVGIITGTYSSICVATPLLVYWNKWSGRN